MTDYEIGLRNGGILNQKYPYCCAEYRESGTSPKLSEIISGGIDRYRRFIGKTPCPVSGAPTPLRLEWFVNGIMAAIKHGLPPAEFEAGGETYSDPAFAWKRNHE